MKRGQKLVGLLWRWHRRTGVLICVFLLLLSVTGVVLNHTSTLGLDRNFVDWRWLAEVYGDQSHEVAAFPVEGRWLARTVDGRLYLDAQEVASCRGELVGVATADELVLAACSEELVLLTGDGELVETLTGSTGLPLPLAGLGLVDGQPVLLRDGNWLIADLDTLDFSRPPAVGAQVLQLSRAELPASLRARLPSPEQWLTWERVVLDLHSGRLGGSVGVFLVDAVAILLICIACSGVTLWAVHRARRRMRR